MKLTVIKKNLKYILNKALPNFKEINKLHFMGNVMGLWVSIHRSNIQHTHTQHHCSCLVGTLYLVCCRDLTQTLALQCHLTLSTALIIWLGCLVFSSLNASPFLILSPVTWLYAVL